jgi:hypothetical protein
VINADVWTDDDGLIAEVHLSPSTPGHVVERELDAYREGEWGDDCGATELAMISTFGERAWVEAPSNADAMAMLALKVEK